jgi:transposase InsO family protein
MEVRSAIQNIFVEHKRRYGYRRVSKELRRRGMLVNHKRVSRLMREDNLLAVQPKAFVVTTDSDHDFEVYLNLASRMKLTGLNQLWVADMTYIRLREWVFLAVILDAFSRRLCRGAAKTRHDSKYESAGESIRQRQLRELHQDSQARGNLRERVPRPGSSPRKHCGVHRQLLQSRAAPFSARLPAARGVRAGGQPRDDVAGSDHEFFQA